jgi:NAD(P)H-hydrate repair Nnr-like enzyme with NAD(P)H-hydrate epimerase domain
MRILLQPELRALETHCIGAMPTLMERAGCAAARLALQRFGKCRVLVCAGPGNNGSNAFVMARELVRAGCAVSVLFRHDPTRLPPNAEAAFHSCRRTSSDFAPRFR